MLRRQAENSSRRYVFIETQRFFKTRFGKVPLAKPTEEFCTCFQRNPQQREHMKTTK